MAAHRTWLVAVALAAAAATAACSSDTGELVAPEDVPESERGPGAPAESEPKATTTASSPGTPTSPARRYFTDQVFPLLGGCTGCHAAGTNGATLLLATNADDAYASLDGNGLIVSPSPLVTKGPHAGGTAPALDVASQAPYVQKWLDMEAAERTGNAAPASILGALGKCFDPALFAKIDLCAAKTKPRIGENGNQCTGCKYEACSNCHAAGGQGTGFWCSTDKEDTLASTRQMPWIRRYVGLAGTEPVPSNAIVNKSTATKTATTASVHPWFELDAARQKALDAFVADAIQKYKAGACAP